MLLIMQNAPPITGAIPVNSLSDIFVADEEIIDFWCLVIKPMEFIRSSRRPYPIANFDALPRWSVIPAVAKDSKLLNAYMLLIPPPLTGWVELNLSEPGMAPKILSAAVLFLEFVIASAFSAVPIEPLLNGSISLSVFLTSL